MPKDEFDFEDPLELNGQVLLTQEDTTDAMCECFIEEFMRMGYSASRICALFRNPHYIGMHMVWQNRGEQFVQDSIAGKFTRWGRPVAWSAEPATLPREQRQPPVHADPGVPPQLSALDHCATDPLGAPVPEINL